eukprot:1161492-Pelagomonas_calceolata.AAC.2
MDPNREVMRNVSRFRLHAHGSKVESYEWPVGSNVCDKRECEVQDEKHVLFYCHSSALQGEGCPTAAAAAAAAAAAVETRTHCRCPPSDCTSLELGAGYRNRHSSPPNPPLCHPATQPPTLKLDVQIEDGAF